MANSQNRFAIDWIKDDLVETLDDARKTLDAFAEDGSDASLMRGCLTSLHQVHGTLVMLELDGTVLLADHLERLAQELFNGSVETVDVAQQHLMRGILQLPVLIDEIQHGIPDSRHTVLELVNEIRLVLGDPSLQAEAHPISINGAVSDASIARFGAIDGLGKAKKIRAAYQQVLLSILKGSDREQAVGTLQKVARGLVRICEDTPLSGLWRAFEGFVVSLGAKAERLDGAAVKMLRHIDGELRELAQEGEAALRRPVPLALVRQLLDGITDNEGTLDGLEDVAEGLEQNAGASVVAPSREALATAASALQEELVLVKDRLDLFVRSQDTEADLSGLVSPLKQISNTLALLGFESSRSIVNEQLGILEHMTAEGHKPTQAELMAVASAFVQVDENLAAVLVNPDGSSDSAMDRITNDAELAVLKEISVSFENVKQGIVAYVSSQWNNTSLEDVPSKLSGICAALDIIPLARPARLLADCRHYVEHLLAGHTPTWEAINALADAISGIDYYLERLRESTYGDRDDVLEVVERSLESLNLDALPEIAVDATSAEASEVADIAEAEAVASDTEEASASTGILSAVVEEVPEQSELVETASDEQEAQAAQAVQDPEAVKAPEAPVFAAPDDQEPEEIKLEFEASPDFDLGSDLFDTDDAVEDAVQVSSAAISAETPMDAASSVKTEVEAETEAFVAEPVAISAAAAAIPANVEPDEEIVEIFVEEVDEVMEAMDEQLAIWRADVNNEAPVSEIRRGFHTLKGSGRIVGANVIGELAWSVENMLNRVMDSTVTPDASFVGVIDRSRALLPALKDAFVVGDSGDLDAVAVLMEQADLLASGGELDVSSDELGVEDAEDDLEDDREIFAAEAIDCVEVVRVRLESETPEVDEAFVRAFHTLQGSAGTIGLLDLVAIIKPAYRLAETYRGLPEQILSNSAQEYFAEVIGTIEMLIGDPVLAEVQDFATEFAARAEYLSDELSSPRTGGPLSGESAEVLVGAAAFMSGWLNGSLDLGMADRVRGALENVSEAYSHRSAMVALSTALMDVHQQLEDDVLTQDAYAALSQGHDVLLACIDAEFANMDAPTTDGAVAQLNALLTEVASADAREQSSEHADEHADEPAGELVEEPDKELVEEQAEASATAADDDLSDAEMFGQEPEEEDEVAIAAAERPEEAQKEESQKEDIVDLALPELPGLPSADVLDFPSDETMSLQEVFASASEDDIEEIEIPELPNAEISQFAEVAQQDQAAPEPAAVDAGMSASELAAEISGDAGDDVIDEDIDFEIIEVFFEEADEILENVDHNTHEWMGDRDNKLYLENLLREMHTLKGGARLAGLMKLGDATHTFESFLIEVQDAKRAADDTFFREFQSQHDELVSTVGRLKRAVADYVERPSESEVAAAETVAAEAVPAEAVTDAPATQLVEASETEIDAAQTEQNLQVIASKASERDANMPRDAKMSRDAKMPAVAAKTPAPEEAEIERARPPQEVVRVGSGLLESLVNLAGESSIVRARIEQGMSDFTSALDEMETTIERLREQLRRMEIETEAQILYREDAPEYKEFDPLEMDRYSQQQQLSRALSESASDMLDLKETLLFKSREAEALLIQQARVNTELQEGLMRTRMVPFSRLLPRLRRIVRQVSRELGKEVEFHAYNAEGELDRNLLERMVPPLEHMLRNAVDHGIESTDLRRGHGKSAAGRIDLRLSREGGDVVLEINDDGAGIDVETVRAKALEKGLMSSDAKLTDDEIVQFVLAPGFSTAKSLTQISGRGVGMDVVNSEVKQLGGSIDIMSRPGKGTRITVRLPFTVSVNRALMVTVGEDAYAIPLNTIEGIVLLSKDELSRYAGSETKTFEYAGIPYNVQYLGQYLGRTYEPGVEYSSVPVVLARSGDQAIAVFVDSVQGSREIVVKSLGPQFAGVGGISGATILGDGSVVIILDLHALIRASTEDQTTKVSRAVPAIGTTRCVMVVDDSVTVRKVTSRLLERQGMDVIVAKDGVEAVALLQERRPDIMLLDIEMPRMDGFEVARQVRHDDRLGELPIVMISSRTGDKHQEHALEIGVNRFLGKPFQESELLATIDELVQ